MLTVSQVTKLSAGTRIIAGDGHTRVVLSFSKSANELVYRVTHDATGRHWTNTRTWSVFRREFAYWKVAPLCPKELI